MEISNVLKSKLKSGKNNLLKDERKLKKSHFNAGKVVTIGFWTFTAGIIFFSFQAYTRTGFLNDKINNLQKVTATQIENLNQTGFINSPAGEDFSKRFATAFMNIPEDQKGRDARAKDIQNYFADGMTLDQVEDLSNFKGKRILNDIELYKIKNVTNNTVVYQFRVNYNVVNATENTVTTPAKDKNSQTQTQTVLKDGKPVSNEALLSVPLGTDGISFNVIEQPYFDSLPVGTRLAAVTDPSNPSDRNYKVENQLKDFTTQFFTSYTTNTVEEMAYLMNNPESLKGIYQFKGLEDFAVYNGQKGMLIVKSLVDMQDANSNLMVKQPVTLYVTNQNGKFFVNKIDHSIGG